MKRLALFAAAIVAASTFAAPPAAQARIAGCADPAAPKPHACRHKAAGHASSTPPGAASTAPAAAKGHPSLEIGGTSPAVDTEMSLLKPGMFRLDMSAYYASYLSHGFGQYHASTIQGAFLLGYGVNQRLTIFAGAIESNNTYSNGPMVAEYLAPKVGLVFRIANAPQFFGNTLDVISSFGGNEVLKPPIPSASPYGDIGSTLKSRLVATREMGHGLTLQASGGLQAAFVDMHDGPWSGEGTYVNALIGVAGQYRLSPISDRLYLNASLDWLKPLTNDDATKLYASPFGTLESYSGTLGATYVVRPQFIILRALDTVAYNRVDSDNTFGRVGPHHVVTNMVGLTLSILGHAPTFGS